MEFPTEEQIEVVISELQSDTCQDKENHTCELCSFGNEMDKRGTSTEPSMLDSFMLSGIEGERETVLPALLIGGPPLLTIFRKIAHASFFIGYKTAINAEAARALEKAFKEE